MNRREFLEAVAAAAAVPAFAGRKPCRSNPAKRVGHVRSSTCTSTSGRASGNFAHFDGAGITKANLLTRGPALDRVKAMEAAAPGRFTWFNSYDVTKPDAEQVLTQAAKDGAQGFGELKFHVAADGPELRRMYALAAELKVPLLIHFQEVRSLPERGHLEHRVREDLRVDPEGISEDDVHRPRRRVLGQRQRRLPEPGRLSDRADRARRRHRQVARRLPESLRRHVGQLRQQRACRATRCSPPTS